MKKILKRILLALLVLVLLVVCGFAAFYFPASAPFRAWKK